MSDIIKKKCSIIDRSKVTVYENLDVPKDVDVFKKGLTTELKDEPLLASIIEDAFEMGYALALYMKEGEN